MQLLLDTHALSGGWPATTRSRPRATAIADEANGIFVSAASAWEITTKHRIGKLPGAAAIVGDLDAIIVGQGFAGLPIGIRHGQVAGALPGPHRDPFDRMLIAQAMLENLVLVSNEAGLRRLRARRDYGDTAPGRVRRRRFSRLKSPARRPSNRAPACARAPTAPP